ncbi:DUF1700 domain-containing protein [Roseburia sp. MSJ-14]|uniref:DUF1700 domain-containing protein n=1 Tax=Roseburia sp. MSJ-14 TaxID=2841514 RepID=UPI001C1044BE|nr:hypothetical protein [Roseburia sp. MSJ-14]MBU5473060.1 hypothetical protein [Roseburia sp. MSJ-14]
MSREEFMKQLETLLSDVPEEEKREALEYYRGYFEDAGEENEERILKELESPEKVAQTIKADLGMEKNDSESNGNNAEFATQKEAGKQDNNDKSGRILLIVILAVITSPIWVGAVGGLLGGALGLAGGILGVAIAAIAVAGALYIAGAAVIGLGIGQLVVGGIATGTAMLGAGLLVLALAVLATIGCVWLYGRFIPWLVHGCVTLCKRAFSGKGRAE